ncbi:MAG TPA: potassium channel family protein, partial [Thermoanaerobaculia bacterium]|nr:potassium channel family protein [Thermoanaerobaculia bacterium]
DETFGSYGASLWWTTLRIATVGADSWPVTVEGKVVALLVVLYGFGMFGYLAAMLASWFVRDDQEEQAIQDRRVMRELRTELREVRQMVQELGERAG